MARRRRKRNPAGAEVLPWLLGIAAVGGVGYLVYSQVQAQNAAALAAAAQTKAASGQPVVDNTGKDITTVINDIAAGVNAVKGTVVTTLSNGATVYADGSGGYYDSNGNSFDQTALDNAALMG